MQITQLSKALMFFTALGCSQLAAAQSYKIDPAHSFIVFKISHIGISTTVGQFPGMTGTLILDAENPSQSKVEAVVNTNNIDSQHAERDKHLRGRDFLNVKQFPNASFQSTKFEGSLESGTLYGDLKLMGATKPISLPVQKVGEGKDPWGGYRVGYTGTIKLNRKDFGINYDMGPATDEVQLEIFIEGIKN